jgi:pyrroline-5-carboxylate reductase
MGETLIRGWLSSGQLAPEQIVATAKTEQRRKRVKQELEVEVTASNREAAASADLVVLGVKPQLADLVLREIREVLDSSRVLVSILAGVSLEYLESRLPEEVPVIRAMPNTPSLIGAGMSALCGGRHTTAEQLEEALALFAPLGRAMILEERYFDAVTGLSASGPAFIYIVIEALAEGGVKVGLSRNVATELAAQTCLGAAQMVLETGEHPATLKDAVTTPAGCTIDGILKLEEGGVRVTLIKAIVEATRRARELVQ